VNRYILLGFAGKNLLHAVHNMMGHEWLAVVLADVAIRIDAGL